jgi:nitrate/nitrite-specific signal transduction histidine kinase
MKSLPRLSLGKYRDLVLRDLVLLIAIFIFIDASISVINIYTSHQIEDDTIRINAAGEMRASSYRTDCQRVQNTPRGW